MQSICGSFAMHRIKTVDGKNAIMLVPEPDDSAPMLHGSGFTDESEPITFEAVEGGESPEDSYLTITLNNGDKIHFGPYMPRVIVQ